MDFHTLPPFPGGSDSEPSQRERHASALAVDRLGLTLLLFALGVLALFVFGFVILVLAGACAGGVYFA